VAFTAASGLNFPSTPETVAARPQDRTRIVFGERDDVGIADDERRRLAAYPKVTIVEIANAGHFTLNEQPEEIAGLLLDVLRFHEHQ
jgi:pimeloyl-ACP methyl ester carboxylesterase